MASGFRTRVSSNSAPTGTKKGSLGMPVVLSSSSVGTTGSEEKAAVGSGLKFLVKYAGC